MGKRHKTKMDICDIGRRIYNKGFASANDGNILIIPREGGYMVRLYIEMDKLAPDERIAARAITIDHLIAAAQADGAVVCSEVLADLLALELAGEIVRQPDGRFSRARAPQPGSEGSAG